MNWVVSPKRRSCQKRLIPIQTFYLMGSWHLKIIVFFLQNGFYRFIDKCRQKSRLVYFCYNHLNEIKWDRKGNNQYSQNFVISNSFDSHFYYYWNFVLLASLYCILGTLHCSDSANSSKSLPNSLLYNIIQNCNK